MQFKSLRYCWDSWLGMPTVAYYKTRERLHIYKAEPNIDEHEITAVSLDLDTNYLHTVEVANIVHV